MKAELSRDVIGQGFRESAEAVCVGERRGVGNKIPATTVVRHRRVRPRSHGGTNCPISAAILLWGLLGAQAGKYSATIYTGACTEGTAAAFVKAPISRACWSSTPSGITDNFFTGGRSILHKVTWRGLHWSNVGFCEDPLLCKVPTSCQARHREAVTWRGTRSSVRRLLASLSSEPLSREHRKPSHTKGDHEPSAYGSEKAVRSVDQGSIGTTTRSDFLRRGSVLTAVAAGAASSAFFQPERRRAANAATILAAPDAAETNPTAGIATANEMVWLDEDSGTVSSKLSTTDETYGQGFVSYLARFLLNYDEGCREYFNGKLDVLVPKRDGSHIWEEFQGFVASVGLGLDRFEGARGARDLCDSLSRKYATAEYEGAAEQLAMLFSLLPPSVQPVSMVRSLLAAPSSSGLRMVKTSESSDLQLSSVLGESPSAMLPADFRPRYDEDVRAYFVPGLPKDSNASAMEVIFGSRGPFPTSKERRLTAVDFALFAACGAVGCTTTHMTVIPLDVVKTRLQTSPGRYEGLAQGVTTIAREEGWPMLLQGSGPTLAGYFWYGITVYPGYELFKRLFIELVGPLNAALFRVPLVLAAGATATFFACVGVCPAEAVRIRQVADPSVGDLPSAVRQIVAESGWSKLYDGLPSILFRQISFGMMKFLVFDFFTEYAYALIPSLAEQTSTQLAVSLTSGLVAGVCAAIVSQPADTVLSVLNRDSERASISSTMRAIIEERGVGGLFLGLQSRIVWSGAIISGQFLLYDVCKTALHVSADDLRVFLDAISSAGL